MANLDALITKARQEYKDYTDNQNKALTDSYNQLIASNNALYNNNIAQANQQLEAVPGQFAGQRNGADISKNQALSWLPKNLADSGSAVGSGADYQARTNIGTQYLNNMNTIGKAQNSAIQQAQNNINTINANNTSNLNNLYAQRLKDQNSLNSDINNKIMSSAQNMYSAELQREAEAEKLAEQRRQYNENLKYKYSTSNNKSTKSSSNDSLLRAIASSGMAEKTSKNGKNINYMNAGQNINSLLDKYGITDDADREKAFLYAKIPNYMQTSIDNVVNDVNNINNQYHGSDLGKMYMQQALENRFKDHCLGFDSETAIQNYNEIAKTYGLKQK